MSFSLIKCIVFIAIGDVRIYHWPFIMLWLVFHQFRGPHFHFPLEHKIHNIHEAHFYQQIDFCCMQSQCHRAVESYYLTDDKMEFMWVLEEINSQKHKYWSLFHDIISTNTFPTVLGYITKASSYNVDHERYKRSPLIDFLFSRCLDVMGPSILKELTAYRFSTYAINVLTYFS